MDKSESYSIPKRTKKLHLNKALLTTIFNICIVTGVVFLVSPIITPYINNSYQKIKNINIYKSTYRQVFTLLNTLTPILPPMSVNTNKTNIAEAEKAFETNNINFAPTQEEQKNYHTNTYSTVTNLELSNPTLRISAASIEGKIVDGMDESALSRGFWFLPVSAKPGEKGNTVIIGHRFLKIPPARDTFFNLDKLAVGDKIEIEIAGELISYTVLESKIIDPNQREVIYPTNDYRLTLITCAPLWKSSKRLVVVAIQDRVEQGI